MLHHVEDVTHLLVATALERHLIEPPARTPTDNSGAAVDALRRDALARRVRATLLLDRSRLVVERMSRRIDGDDTD